MNQDKEPLDKLSLRFIEILDAYRLDFGLEYSAAYNCLKYHDDKFTPKDFENFINKLETLGYIETTQENNGIYIKITKKGISLDDSKKKAEGIIKCPKCKMRGLIAVEGAYVCIECGYSGISD
jgi:hypothetical protein